MRCQKPALSKRRYSKQFSLDDPETTLSRIKIINRNKFLRLIYEEWVALIKHTLPPSGSHILELGSGTGFLKTQLPHTISSEITFYPHIDISLDARHLPFRDQSLDGIIMINVFHHIPDVALFLKDAERCVKTGGVITMIEPWVTLWSKFIYTHFHNEPFLPNASSWNFSSTGPLSCANGALPWIVFQRDKSKFIHKFSGLSIQRIEYLMPIRYLLSGGMSHRNLMPPATFTAWRFFEKLIKPFYKKFAMFALINLVKNSDDKTKKQIPKIKQNCFQ